MDFAAANVAVRVRHEAHLSEDVIAQAVGAKPRMVRGWIAGKSEPKGERARRLTELAEITDRLSRVVDAHYIPMWMVRPHQRLDQCTPVEAMAAGRGRHVARLVGTLEEPRAA